MVSVGFELAKDLVVRAQQAGFNVPAEQIARWNRAGLLPRPHQHGLGQGRGSEIQYPIGTGDQLMALCFFHRQFRKLNVVGWYLWLNGFEVDRKYWIFVLTSAADLFERNRKILKEKLVDTSQNIVSLRRAGDKLLRNLADVGLGSGQMRRLRRRVGKAQIGEFCRIMLTIWAGAYRSDREANERDRQAEREIIVSGFGLRRAWIDRTADDDTLLNEPIEPDLEKFSVQIGRIAKAKMLRAIRSDEIELARDELRLLFLGLTVTYYELKNKSGPHAFGLGVITDFGTITDIKLQALLILLFELTIRSDPDNRLREVLAVIEAKRVNHGRQLDLPVPAA